MDIEELLWVAAVAFAVVNGFNDGAALLAVGLRVRSLSLLAGVVVLSAAVAVVPVLVGTRVAATLATRLVSLEGSAGRMALLVAVAAGIAVTFGLSSAGLPTSLTLALVGAIAGVGVGGGLGVAWGVVVAVLLVAAVAPVLGVVVGGGLARLVSLWRSETPLHRRVRRWHPAGFVAQSAAYGANDGQKMIAVAAIAVGGAAAGGSTAAGGNAAGVSVAPWLLAVLAVGFLVGTVAGLPRVASTLATGLVPVQPANAVVAEWSAAVVVLVAGAAGMPVSMTQVVSGAVVGTGVTRGHGRVRWEQAAAIAGAWALTLPLAFGLAAGAAMLVV